MNTVTFLEFCVVYVLQICSIEFLGSPVSLKYLVPVLLFLPHWQLMPSLPYFVIEDLQLPCIHSCSIRTAVNPRPKKHELCKYCDTGF